MGQYITLVNKSLVKLSLRTEGLARTGGQSKQSKQSTLTKDLPYSF